MIKMAENIESLFSRENLRDSWLNIAAKKSAPGIDNVSVEMFSRSLESNLDQLHYRICHHDYNPQPLIVFPKEKKDKSYREITIPTISDKIVAKTVADFEVRKFNSMLEPQSYAYRPHRSATQAVTVVENTIRKNNVNFVARIDIKDFFESLNHPILKNMLLQFGNPDEIVDLLMLFAKNRRFDGVSLLTPESGIPQGSPVAPVISNLYLDCFDKIMNENQVSFLRYADDIIIFAENAEQAGNQMNLAITTLNSISLDISIDKTRIYRVTNGFIFLGFLFSANGKLPCREAENQLSEKLSAPKYDDETDEEYAKRIKAIIRGWKNYYYFDVANPEKSPEENEGIVLHETLDNSTQPIVDVMAENDNFSTNMLQQSDELVNEINQLIDLERDHEAIRKIRFLLSGDYEIEDDVFKSMHSKLADLYDKQGLCGAAERCRKVAGYKNIENRYKSNDDLVYGTDNVNNWLDIFSSDSYIYRQYVDRVGRMGYKPASKGLNPAYLKDHWLGKHTLAVPIFDTDNFVRFAVMDFDVSRKQLDTFKVHEITELKQRLLDDARGVLDIAFKAGVKGIIEDSGYKGYHVWFFFYERIPAKLAKNFLQSLNRVAGNPPEGSHRELFPASDTLKNDQLNSRIKLPLGFHRLTAKYSQFLKPDGSVSENGILALSVNAFFNKCSDLKKALKNWDEFFTNEENSANQQGNTLPKQNDSQLLFESCAVLKAIKQKAEVSKNLSHYERVVLRGILAPLGNEGRIAIHSVMKNCSNYSKSLTDKMLADDRSKPMGCSRIREILSYLVQKVDCNCHFRETKNDYKHPLRHLNKKKSALNAEFSKIKKNTAETEIASTVDNPQDTNIPPKQKLNNEISNTPSKTRNFFMLHIDIASWKFDIKLSK